MEDLKSFAEKRVKERPFLEEIGALHTAIYDIMSALEPGPVPAPDFETAVEKFALGVPLLLIPGAGFDDKKTPARIFRELTRLEKANVPEKFALSCARLSGTLERPEDAETAIESLISGNDGVIRYLAEKAETDAGLIAFLGWAAIARWLRPVAKDIGRWAEKNLWDGGSCPACGGEPVAAVLRQTAKGKRRYLACGSCHTQWAHRRIGCPYCGNVDQSLLRILEVPDEPGLRADACDACGSYIKTREQADGDAAAEDWAFLHIDVLCAEAGYKKRGYLISAS